MLAFAFLNKIIIRNYVKYLFFMFCIGLHPWENNLLSQRNLTKLCLKRSACNSVEDFGKAVAAVTDDKKVLVVLKKNW